MADNAARDENHVTTVLGVSSADLVSTVTWAIDPVSHRGLVQGYAATGVGAPNTTPTSVGQIFIDTSTGTVYFSTGTSSSADWTELLPGNSTVTPAGTTGARTINKPAGSVNFAAAASSLVVTNSRVTTSSIILITVATADATMTSATAVAGSGSFTIRPDNNPTAETRVNFLVIN